MDHILSMVALQKQAIVSILLIFCTCSVHSQQGIAQPPKLIVRRRILIPNWNNKFQTGVKQIDSSMNNFKNLGPLARAVNDQLKTRTPRLLNYRQVFSNERRELLDYHTKEPFNSLQQPSQSRYPSAFRYQWQPQSLEKNFNVYQKFVPATWWNARPDINKFRTPRFGPNASLSQAIRNIPYVAGRSVQRQSPTKWPFIVGTFDNPENLIRIPFQRDFLTHSENGNQLMKGVVGPLDLTKNFPLKYTIGGSNSNSLNLESRADDGPLDNGVVFENSFEKRGPLQPGEREKIYYDGKVFKRTRTKIRGDTNDKNLSSLRQDFHKFLSSPSYMYTH